MQNRIIKKFLVTGLIFLFICVSNTSSTNSRSIDKTKVLSSNSNILYVGGIGPGNYSKIQDAINNASDGYTIFVYNGIYQEKTIKIDKAIKLLGEDRNSTFLDGEYTEGIIVSVRISDVTIREFTLQNCYADGFGYAIRLFNASCIIENIKIADCIIKNSDRCIKYEDVVNLLITNCHFHHNPGQVTMGWDSSNINIRDCVSYSNGKNWGGGWITPGAFEFGDSDTGASCSDVEIFNCTLYWNIGFGISFLSGSNIDIYQNQMYSNTWYGVYFYSTGPLYNIDFYDNHVYKNYIAGLFVSGVTEPGIEIHDNNISKNGQGLDYEGGIQIQSSGDCVTIQDNIISSNKGYGIYPRAGNIIIGNDIDKNTEYGIYLPSQQNTIIKYNNIRENKIGIYLRNNANKISGNIISENEYGIQISGMLNMIDGNKISNNEFGIYINDMGFSNEIIRNEISNNSEGIKLYGENFPLASNNISFNNFLNNNKDVFFKFISYRLVIDLNYFKHNYWDRKRILPKAIYGTYEIILTKLNLKFKWIYVDWYPAKTPNDIAQDFDNPIYKNISTDEKNEEYKIISIERNISNRVGFSSLISYRYS